MMRFVLCLALALIAPLPGGAHPHVFIQGGLSAIFNDRGQLTHVQVTWAYDAFYSLLVAQDMGLDRDNDGALTAAEEAKLSGFDAKWDRGFNGDLVATLEGRPLTLSRPLRSTARMIEGQIVSTHLRRVKGKPVVAGNSLSLKMFDETYYTSYDMTLPVRVVGADRCQLTRTDPDIDQELAQMQAMLLSIDANADLEEMDIPLIGEAFATEIKVTCPSS